MKILIISDYNDSHIPFVARHLKDKPLVIGSKDLIRDNGFDVIADKNQVNIIYKDKILPYPDSIWYRKPTLAFFEELPVKQKDYEYSKSALRTHLEGVYPFWKSAFWVSDFFAIRRASSKPLQLQLALKLGFNVPDTIFAGNQNQARQFIKTHPNYIVKSQATVFPAKNDTVTCFYTRHFNKNDDINLDNLNLAPSIFQEAINPEFDIRVTVVGKEVFAAAIYVNLKDERFKGVLDWRAMNSTNEGQIEAFKLPSDIEEKCIKHVRDLGLKFGAIDLIQDKHGKIWFLENNPNGQWAFVEEETKQPIGKSLAKLLEERNTAVFNT